MQAASQRHINVLAPPVQQVDRTFVRFCAVKLSYFGGCDYFRLSSHPLLLKAFQRGLKKYGLTVAASRVTTGNHLLYELLESKLAKFFGAPQAVLISSGYLANLAVTQALAGAYSHALLDERAHASLVDAAQFLDCPVIRFRHRNPGALARILQRIGPATRPILLTDGMFSRDGTTAPLQEYLQTLPSVGLILVDDAHGAGVLGQSGQGTLEHCGVSRRRIIQTIALSKAFGAYGGAVLCDAALRQSILTTSRLFSGNTPLPLPMASAALKALEILSTTRNIRTRLFKNMDRLRTDLRKSGLAAPGNSGPIIAFTPRHPKELPRLKREFVAHGIFPSFIKYPGGPIGGYCRLAISSEHTPAQLQALVNLLKAIQESILMI